MSDATDMIVPMLREMRAETREQIDAVRREMREGFEAVDRRLEKVEAAQKTFRNALSADTLLTRLVTGDFEERILDLERKIAFAAEPKA